MRVLAYAISLLLLTTFPATFSQVTLTSNVTVEGTVCPGAVQFACRGIDLSHFRWKFSGTTEDIKRYSPTSELGSSAEQNGQIVVELISVEKFSDNANNANFSSTLTVDLVTLQMHVGQSVQCGDLGNNQRELPILNFEIRPAPPQPIYTCSIAAESGNSVSLTLHWNSTASSNIDKYCVRATCGSQLSEACVGTGTPYSCGGVEAGLVHRFDVATVNCDNQYFNDTFTVEPRVPARLITCNSIPVYEKSTNHLDRIQTVWSAIAAPTEAQTGPCTSQDITEYIVSYGNMEVLVSSDICTPGAQCSYNILDNFRGSELDYTVAVSGRNIVGKGQVTTCTPRHIGSSNEVIDITTDTVAESPSIVCDFLTVLIGAAQCEVCYSVDPLCQEPTCLSMQAGARGVAVIDLPSLESGVQYCYIVTAVIGGVTAAKVEGTFSTACNISDLTCSRIRSHVVDQRCNGTDGSGSVSIVSGVVCYTGMSAGATATYQCDIGYEVATGQNPRTCQRDGNWDGYTLICVPENSIQEVNIGGAVGATFIVTLIATLSIAAAIMAVIIYLMMRHQLAQKKTMTRNESIADIYEEIPRHVRQPPPTPQPRPKAPAPAAAAAATATLEEYEYPDIGFKNKNKCDLDYEANVAYNPVVKT